MKKSLIYTLVAALLAVSVAPALAQDSGFTVKPDRMELKAAADGDGQEAEDDWATPAPAPADFDDSDNIGSSEQDGVRSDDNLGSSGEDGVEPADIEHEDIGGTVRQNNESDYDFVLRAISTETAAQAVFVKFDDIEGEAKDSESDPVDVELEWKVEEGESLRKPKEIVVVGSKVRGWDSKTKEAVLGSAPAEPAGVATAQDLAYYAAKVVAETEEAVPVESVTLNFEKITWEYKQQGRFLGFIPLSVPTTLEVDNDPVSLGRVKVKLPWYARFIGKTLSAGELEEIWTDEYSRSRGDDAQLANIDLQNALQKQAQTLQMMSNISKMLHDTAMAVIRKIG